MIISTARRAEIVGNTLPTDTCLLDNSNGRYSDTQLVIELLDLAETCHTVYQPLIALQIEWDELDTLEKNEHAHEFITDLTGMLEQCAAPGQWVGWVDGNLVSFADDLE